MIVKKFNKQTGKIRKISESYSVLNLLTSSDSDRVSIAVGTAENYNETTRTASDRAYYIIEGEITVNDRIKGRAEEIIYVPANTKYNFCGTFKAVIINSPPFRKEEEDIIKQR